MLCTRMQIYSINSLIGINSASISLISPNFNRVTHVSCSLEHQINAPTLYRSPSPAERSLCRFQWEPAWISCAWFSHHFHCSAPHIFILHGTIGLPNRKMANAITYVLAPRLFRIGGRQT